MVRWWAVFFIAGIFFSGSALSAFYFSVLLVIDQFRKKPFTDILFAIDAAAGPVGIRTRLARDFIIISSTSLIVFSASDTISLFSAAGHTRPEETFRADKVIEAAGSKDTDGWLENAGTLSGIERSISRARKILSGRIDHPHLDTKARQLLRTLLLAERRAVEYSLLEEYRFIGISHFLALSGLHLGIITISFSFILRICLRSRPAREIALFTALAAYVVLAGCPHSLLRAFSLFASFRIFRYSGIKCTLDDALITGSFLLLTVKPELILSTGYQLSFMAVSAIAFIAFPALQITERYLPAVMKKNCIKYLFSAVTITISIQIFTLPLILEYFGRIPLISVAANLLLILPVTAILHLGLLLIILPPALSRYTVVPLIGYLSRIMTETPSFLSSVGRHAIIRGSIEPSTFAAGVIFLILSLKKRSGGKKGIVILSIFSFTFSVAAGAMGGRAINPLSSSHGGSSLVKADDGVIECFGEKRMIIIEKKITFRSAERYMTDLWKRGVPAIDIVIYTPGSLADPRGLDLLLRRMKVREIFCSPYLEGTIRPMTRKGSKEDLKVSAVDSFIVLRGNNAMIEIAPPSLFPLKKGERLSVEDSGISFSIKQ
ncbi:MAG: ComEC/Rec2 family competence protein [Candidatus Krumholzibacteriota bacterium]|nr:ComEC/Rec2 family competence protein [Candidatus Krumholzibacteriota bacterium]